MVAVSGLGAGRGGRWRAVDGGGGAGLSAAAVAAVATSQVDFFDLFWCAQPRELAHLVDRVLDPKRPIAERAPGEAGEI